MAVVFRAFPYRRWFHPGEPAGRCSAVDWAIAGLSRRGPGTNHHHGRKIRWNHMAKRDLRIGGCQTDPTDRFRLYDTTKS